jgi:hypothetical protein
MHLVVQMSCSIPFAAAEAPGLRPKRLVGAVTGLNWTPDTSMWQCGDGSTLQANQHISMRQRSRLKKPQNGATSFYRPKFNLIEDSPQLAGPFVEIRRTIVDPNHGNTPIDRNEYLAGHFPGSKPSG